jgi:hypothetical protein
MSSSTSQILFALATLSLAAASPVTDLDQRWGKRFYGKTLLPTNYTVVPGIFYQDEPTYNNTNYNSLTDSLGLLDKSPGRWDNLTRWVDLRCILSVHSLLQG